MLMSTAFQVGIILLRESAEAILILLAVSTIMHSLAPNLLPAVWAGASLGIIASVTIGLAVVQAGGAMDFHPNARSLICFVAAVVMLWAGGWLWRRADPLDWNIALEQFSNRMLGSRYAPLAIGAIGFFAVSREGVETVLFLAAIGGSSMSYGLLGGVMVLALMLGAIWYISAHTLIRLPVRRLFQATSIFLLLTAVKMVVEGTTALLG